VPESQIRLGADWAWLYRKRHDLCQWAAAVWHHRGVDLKRPLLVANVVNMLWRDRTPARQALASALNVAAQQFDLQIAFFCNESRSGEFFDYAAAQEIGAMTGRPHALVPAEYYSPDEALALLAHATVSVGLRYHFVVQSVMAGTVPVGILRGQKMAALADDLPFPVGGTIEKVDRDQLVDAIRQGVEHRIPLLTRLSMRRIELTRRATNNLSFLEELPPYRSCRQFNVAC
jgi:polysaccharide pyruvyl transferase WcaK-like protein